MRNCKMKRLIGLSFKRTIFILFQPFCFKKWLFLILIAFLAGAMGTGAGSGGSHYRLQEREKIREVREVSGENNVTAVPAYRLERNFFNYDFLKEKQFGSFNGINFKTLPFIILFLFVFFILFISIWLGSRFKFIWFNSLVKNDASLAGPFKDYKKQGNSLFKLYLLLFFVLLGVLGLITFWIAILSQRFSGYYGLRGMSGLLEAVKVFFLPGLFTVALFSCLFFLYFLIDHFITTIMAIDRSSFSQAFSKLVAIYKKNWKEFWFYILVFFSLYLLSKIISVVLVLILILLFAIGAALLFGIPYLIFVFLFQAMPLFIIYAAIIAIPFFLAVIFMLISANLPFVIFFRTFSLYFMASLDCGYYPLQVATAGCQK